ncbi:glycoside hydrolase/phage tail family protein [Tropicimonas sp. IMCC34011]|uniref:baseplate multidomain protein megatron n=1 Tax=Tropicimonas sp. IMCC34011 TaxID=2248759 RepID=UPI000E250D85|nr:glycoside hydrolase/phage tail family protein [Tropicimonas sp. IMCC34011]
MATILLSAAGAAVGGMVGGSVLGLSSAVIGRAIGASIGQVIDQRLMGSGSEVVEGPRLDRYRITGASDGAPVRRVWGRVRVAGQVIWATEFEEHVKKTRQSGGGKGGGGGSSVTTKSYSYSVSLAVALCEGEILRVGRVWADGIELPAGSLDMRVYTGSEDQLPDPRIEAVEGEGMAPAYRGIAYVVIEDLALGEFGNRVPQLTFEVVRPAQGDGIPDAVRSLSDVVKAVALVPGTGEYALATTPVRHAFGLGRNEAVNAHSPLGRTDFAASLLALEEELPECGSVSLVVSWFGGDLRCGSCAIEPKVEQRDIDGVPMKWRAGGIGRSAARTVPRIDERPIYGGTPADGSVIEAIRAIRETGREVMFYPFILMDQVAGNDLVDPWSGTTGQPALPWRGRVTTSLAPGLGGSPDGTVAAGTEVAAFFGAAEPGDFERTGGEVLYHGPDEWSFRRFILHYAHLCSLAGGVDSFCIGSEMRGVTQIRGAGGTYPAVAELVRLAADVRSILGVDTKIGYAADWSEYFGHHPQDGSGDVRFHLDPFWSQPAIDFVGIDNYMPLSDWRDGEAHADAEWGSIYNAAYLEANVAGGEGYDWYYPDTEARVAQRRMPIEDGAYAEPWVFRPKDLRGWWENPHHERIGGVRQTAPTDWVPGSKPIRFTEIGCAAIDKGTNQPNRFVDAKSSESGTPHHSDGTRDDLIQAQYLRAMTSYWGRSETNPVSDLYGGPMVDMTRAHVWAWDARPFPYFPALGDVWSDGENYARGHWLNGRTSGEDLGAVVAEICLRAGAGLPDVSGLHGTVRGFSVEDGREARGVLQPLMLAYGFEAIERDGRLMFRTRTGAQPVALSFDALAEADGIDGAVERIRAPKAEIAGRVRLTYLEAETDFEVRTAEAAFPGEPAPTVSHSERPLTLTPAEARGVVERWLAEARVARDGIRFAVPPSRLDLGAGDVVALGPEGGDGRYRIDRVEQGDVRIMEAVRVEPQIYVPSEAADARSAPRPWQPPMPVEPIFLDLPLLTGEEVPHAPHLAVAGDPWPGAVAVYSSGEDAGYGLDAVVEAPASVGVTEAPLLAASPGRWDLGPPLRVRMARGTLSSADGPAVLGGANALAIGSGAPGAWEIVQFAEAVLVGAETWELSRRLRGQAGTDAVMPAEWPAGSLVVLLDGTPEQIPAALSARGLARHYRIGPASLPMSDAAYVHRVESFDGTGLRPYAPAHLRARAMPDGDIEIGWIRRTRIGGDSWQGEEVPLGEETERYRLRVLAPGGAVLRETVTETPSFIYGAAERAADGPGPLTLSVAQISTTFGDGPQTRIEIHE